MEGRFVEQVRLFNVASYLHASGARIVVPELGEIVIDLAYGGNYYAIVEPQPNWPGLDGMSAGDIQRLSPLVRAAAQAALAPVHPEDPRIAGIGHVMWCDRPRNKRAHARNAVFYGDKAIDRSPCGTGTSARMAQLWGKAGWRSAPSSSTKASSAPCSKAGWSRRPRSHLQGDPPQRRRLGADHRPQHDFRRRPGSAGARVPGGVAGAAMNARLPSRAQTRFGISALS